MIGGYVPMFFTFLPSRQPMASIFFTVKKLDNFLLIISNLPSMVQIENELTWHRLVYYYYFSSYTSIEVIFISTKLKVFEINAFCTCNIYLYKFV